MCACLVCIYGLVLVYLCITILEYLDSKEPTTNTTTVITTTITTIPQNKTKQNKKKIKTESKTIE